MKHYYPLMLGVIFLLLFSCKKADNSNSNNRQEALPVTIEQGVNSGTNPVATLADTIPPANAVSVKKFGAIGNGTHDDTDAIQTALNSETVLTIPAGTYLVNNTLNMR